MALRLSVVAAVAAMAVVPSIVRLALVVAHNPASPQVAMLAAVSLYGAFAGCLSLYYLVKAWKRSPSARLLATGIVVLAIMTIRRRRRRG